MLKHLAVFFGGRSLEHEVSVITAVQLMRHVNPEKYILVPVYCDKSGHWWTGEILKKIEYYSTQDLFSPKNLEQFELSINRLGTQIDLAILCFHGAPGESGQVQGFLDLAGVAYQGPGLLGSAISFDKIVTRQILSAEQIPQTNYTWFNAQEWEKNQNEVFEKIQMLTFPVFVKPANSGSSIGVMKVQNSANSLREAIEQALILDHRVIVESGVQDCIEVNVSVLGIDDDIRVSFSEQPVKVDDFLSFADKYERGGKAKKGGMAGAQRRIPAPIGQVTTQVIHELAKRLFKLLDLSGVVRIDFFVNPSTDDVYVTEVNTIPGSMSYYLWEASNLQYEDLIDHLAQIALKRKNQIEKKVSSYQTNILQKNPLSNQGKM